MHMVKWNYKHYIQATHIIKNNKINKNLKIRDCGHLKYTINADKRR